jgi:DNA modification methylase
LRHKIEARRTPGQGTKPRSSAQKVVDGDLDRAVMLGDCRALMRRLPDASIDAIVCDPPYPGINREYGKFPAHEWHALMDEVCEQAMRVLKPTGSAVFILQPNFERIGRMRPWLFEFMARWSWRWNMVQDAWWVNPSTPPSAGARRDRGLMRGAVKACVWLGAPECHRDQDAVLWTPSDAMMKRRLDDMAKRTGPSGINVRNGNIRRVVEERGGVTPFNMLPIPGHHETHGHPAATPPALCNWWVRYIAPKGGIVLDPFCGSGTVGAEAIKLERRFIGFERMKKYVALAKRRVGEAA